MYGVAAKRFDRDIYKNKRWLKIADFSLGFLISLLAWILFFNPVWWAAPLGVFILCAAAAMMKIKRRYLFYGGLALVFFPFALWAIIMILWAGRKEF
jgi:hypothetical protein